MRWRGGHERRFPFALLRTMGHDAHVSGAIPATAPQRMHDMRNRLKRPLPVWIIFLFYSVLSLYSILSVFLITSGVFPLSFEQQAYINRFTTFDMVIGHLVAATTFIGVFLLFRLKRAALPVLFLALGINIFSSGVFYLKNDPATVIDASGFLLQAGGVALFLVVCLYARHLAKSRVLA